MALLDVTDLRLSFHTRHAVVRALGGVARPRMVDVVRDGKNGWLFPAGDDTALAEILFRLLTAPESASEATSRGFYQAREHHSLPAMVARYETLVAELASIDRSRVKKWPLP